MNLSSLVMRFLSRGGGRRRAVVNLSRREGGDTAVAARSRHLHAAAAWKAPAAAAPMLTTPIQTQKTYSTASGGADVSLAKLLMGKSAKKLLWEEIVSGMARPSPFFRLAIRRVYESLSELKREGKWHGNLKPENIIFPGFDMTKPILINFSDLTGDTREDFKSLGNIIREAFAISGCKVMDPETLDFVKFLRGERVGRMHYWLMSVHDREKFFIQFTKKCPVGMQVLLTATSPKKDSLKHTTSKYFETFLTSRRRGIILGWSPFSAVTKLVRNYFEHYRDKEYSYNKGQEETTVTLYEAELDFFRYYPDYFPALYKELQKLNIEYILS